MATISGRVIFDRNRSAAIDAGDSGLSNIPVVLQNTATDVGLVVLTDTNGNYSFLNVPNGSYRIVESFGALGGVPTPGNFATGVVVPVPVGTNPPISAAANPPAGSTNLDSVTRDTLLVTVSGTDLTNQNFLNGPVIYTPIQTTLDACATISGPNLIVDADNGTFGSFSAGTPANTGAPTAPYPGVTPGFTYVLPTPGGSTPNDGQYTVQNIMNNNHFNQVGTWWRIADHTAGTETGRLMAINGSTPGAVFFRSAVAVQANTYYLLSAWIINLIKQTGFANPALGVRILDSIGNPLYNATLGAQIPVNVNVPEWKEIGTVINSQGNTTLTVEFVSQGPSATGNDYAIDDIALNEILLPIFTPIKAVSPATASVGETVTYAVTLTNTCTSPLTSVIFQDTPPNGLSFVPGTVVINGVSSPSADPNPGFLLPNIPGGGTATVTFTAMVNFLPPQNPALNVAAMTYSYTPVVGGIPNVFDVMSNEVPVLIAITSADVSIVKTASPRQLSVGQVVTYSLRVANAGPSDALNTIVTDAAPSGIVGAEFSTDGGIIFAPWPGSLSLGTFASGASLNLLIRGTIGPSAAGTIVNTATVASSTPDPDPSNNTSSASVNVLPNPVVKSADHSTVDPGTMVLYTITFTNNTDQAIDDLVFVDSPSSSFFSVISSQVIVGGQVFPIVPSTRGSQLLFAVPVSILPGEAAALSLLMMAAANTPAGIYTDTASVEYGATILPPTPPIPVSVNVVTKAANKTAILPGEDIVFTIQFANTTAQPISDLRLIDAHDSAFFACDSASFSIDGSAPTSVSPSQVGNLFSYAIPVTVQSGQLVTLAVHMHAIPGTPVGPYTDNAHAEFDSIITPSSPASVEVYDVLKSSSTTSIFPGDLVDYTISLTNRTGVALTDLVLVDSHDSSFFAPVSAQFLIPPQPSVPVTPTQAGNAFRYTIGSLGANQTVTLQISMRAAANTPAGTYNDTAHAEFGNTITPETPPIPVTVNQVQKSGSTSNVLPGGTARYTITFPNNTGAPITDLSLIDDHDSGFFGFDSATFSIDGGTQQPITPIQAGNSFTYAIPVALNNGSEVVLSVAMSVAPNTPPGTYTDTARAQFGTTVTPNTPPVPVSVSAVTKSGSPAAILPGGEVTYTMLFQNNTGAPLSALVLFDEHDSSFFDVASATFAIDASVPSPIVPSRAGNEFIYTIPTIVPVDALVKIVTTMVAASDTPPGSYHDVASAQYNGIITPPTPPVTVDVFGVTKAESTSFLFPGELITYTIAFPNRTGAPITDLRLIDAHDSSFFRFVSATASVLPSGTSTTIAPTQTGNMFTYLIPGIVPDGSTVLLLIALRADDAIPAGHYEDTAHAEFGSIITPPTPPVPVEVSSIDKRSAQTSVAPGGLVTYTIRFVNRTGQTLTNATLFDNMDSAFFALVSASLSLNGTPVATNPVQVGRRISVPIPVAVPPNAIALLTLVLRAAFGTPPGTYTDTAHLTFGTFATAPTSPVSISVPNATPRPCPPCNPCPCGCAISCNPCKSASCCPPARCVPAFRENRDACRRISCNERSPSCAGQRICNVHSPCVSNPVAPLSSSNEAWINDCRRTHPRGR